MDVLWIFCPTRKTKIFGEIEHGEVDGVWWGQEKKARVSGGNGERGWGSVLKINTEYAHGVWEREVPKAGAAPVMEMFEWGGGYKHGQKHS